MNMAKPNKEKRRLKLEPRLAIELHPEQKKITELLYEYDVVFVEGLWGTGKTLGAVAAAIKEFRKKNYNEIVLTRPFIADKGLGALPGAQPYSSKIYTPKGYTTMGEVKKGDIVYSYKGTPTKVLDIFEQGEREVYEVTTSDGQKTLVCDKHLWRVTERRAKTAKYRQPVILNTLEIKEKLINDHGKYRYSIPRTTAIEWKNKDLKVHPYVLGALLGDGSLSDSIGLCNPDMEVVRRVDSLLEETEIVESKEGIHHNIRITNNTHNKKSNYVKITNTKTNEEFNYNRVGEVPLEKFGLTKINILKYRCYNNSHIDNFKYEIIENKNKYTHPLKNKLNDLNLLYKRAWEKFIPEDYKYSSVEQRLELIRGLMDTDGNVKTNGESTYSTSSKKLAEDLRFIVRSLGGRAFIKERNRIGNKGRYKVNDRDIISRRLAYEVRINFEDNPGLFHLTRKKEREKENSTMHKNKIVSVEKVGREKVKCILIEDNEHLYVTDDFIVTHNTIEEKLSLEMEPIIDNFNICQAKSTTEKMLHDGDIKIQYNGKIKGRTLCDSITIVDEGEDLTYKEFVELLTRLGKGSKMIFTLSKEQIHKQINSKSCYYTIQKLKDSGLVGWLELTSNHRNENINKIIEYLE